MAVLIIDSMHRYTTAVTLLAARVHGCLLACFCLALPVSKFCGCTGYGICHATKTFSKFGTTYVI